MIKFFLLLVIFCSCAGYPHMKKRSFSYTLGESKNIVFFVPAGYKKEQVKVGADKGIEQFYQYNHGAYFYISHRAEWHSLNERFVSLSNDPVKTDEGEFMYSGTDESGLYWKEVKIDSLKWGYSFVPVNLLPLFEQSVNSIRIKNRRRK